MALDLDDVVARLQQIAPLELAESWDNVGLLVEPLVFTGRGGREPIKRVARVFCTIDLSEPVLTEALEWGADLVLAYHPPLFKGVKRLRAAPASDRVLLQAIRHDVAIYSPHTALDSAADGLNDWLVRAVGHGEVGSFSPLPLPGSGVGRWVNLHEPAPLEELVRRIKAALGLSHCRVAAAPEHARGTSIERVGVCAGAGGSVFENVTGLDLYLTGEMRHHDVLAKVQAGASVVLCDHTNTERGYLPYFAERLRRATAAAVEVKVSERDRDPLAVT